MSAGFSSPSAPPPPVFAMPFPPSLRLMALIATLTGNASAALSIPLEMLSLTHEFTPELRLTTPSGGEFYMAPEAQDSVSFDPAGFSFLPEERMQLAFVLSAPAGMHFSMDPGVEAWQFGFALNFLHPETNGSFASATAEILGSSATDPVGTLNAIWWIGNRGGSTLSGLSEQAPTGPFTFSGLRIEIDLTPGREVVPFELESASFGFHTRNMATNSDPGQALTLSPIPEPGTWTLLAMAGAACALRRKRNRMPATAPNCV